MLHIKYCQNTSCTHNFKYYGQNVCNGHELFLCVSGRCVQRLTGDLAEYIHL